MNAGSLREVRQQAQLDLGVVRDDEAASPRRGTKPRRISSPRGVRTGMFCRFGSVDESRPVAAPVWLNAGVDPAGRGVHALREHVDVGRPSFSSSRYSRISRGTSCPMRRELLQHFGVGGRAGLGLLEDREPQLLEQDRGELLRDC